MKIFYFHGPNPKTKGGTSSKIWKIERRGCKVHTWFGSVDLVQRKALVRGKLRSSVATLKTERLARENEIQRIQLQLAQGYYRKPTPSRRNRS